MRPSESIPCAANARHDRRIGEFVCRSWTRAIVICFIAIGLAATGCGKPSAREVALRPSQVHEFEALFRQNCTGCHGADGKLGPAPPLNDAMLLAIASPDDLRAAIVSGRAGTMMPGFGAEQGGALTPLQIDVLVEGIRTHWAKPVADAASLPSYAGAPAVQNGPSAGADSQSLALFKQHCGQCHGDEGRGGEGGALRVPALLALTSDQALRRLIITGRPDLGMPNFRDRASTGTPPLTSAEIDQLAALLAAWRQEPASALSQLKLGVGATW